MDFCNDEIDRCTLRNSEHWSKFPILSTSNQEKNTRFTCESVNCKPTQFQNNASRWIITRILWIIFLNGNLRNYGCSFSIWYAWHHWERIKYSVHVRVASKARKILPNGTHIKYANKIKISWKRCTLLPIESSIWTNWLRIYITYVE